MNKHTENIKYIWEYCKNHKSKYGYGDDCKYDCDIRHNCLYSKKVSRYDDPSFATKMADRIKRLKSIRENEKKKDPFWKYKENNNAIKAESFANDEML